MNVAECIERDFANEPQSVVKVTERGNLRSDVQEYVLTDALAREFVKVLRQMIDSGGSGTVKGSGIWVSGFFGSGKSYFAKLIGHLLADTLLGSESARDLFKAHLRNDRQEDQDISALLQQAAVQGVAPHLVTFDITALDTASADSNVGLTFLRAFHRSLGLSNIPAFAERELELQAAGRYDEFLRLYEERVGVPWTEDKDISISSAPFAECLAELMPTRHPSAELAMQSLDMAMRAMAQMNISDAADALIRWLDRVGEAGRPRQLLFVADEVGAWAGRDLRRIEQIRSLVETFSSREGRDQGGRTIPRVWVIATSQEKLSAVVQNTTDDRELLQRLEARFRTNVHLESSEVGTVIENRILRKKPSSRPTLEALYARAEGQLFDVAATPGLELGANYPPPSRDNFVADYPFLPYQLPAAADIFGGMRGVKVSSGARSMIKVAFDATRGLAKRELGAVVSWDRIFDSANSDNEFADEQYLGSQGLHYLGSADRDVRDAPLDKPSRLLKVLWLVQQSRRIPRTERNLARLLVEHLDTDLLTLEREVAATLAKLADHDYVRAEVGTDQWRFLTQDEVTIEKIVKRIAEGLTARDVRDAIAALYEGQLRSTYNGRLTHGRSNTSFDYGVFLNDSPIRSDSAPVALRVALGGSAAATKAERESGQNLDEPTVYWILAPAARLEDRVRRYLAIERLGEDEEYRRIATERTKLEAVNLQSEGTQLRRDAGGDVERAFAGGRLLYGGQALDLDDGTGGARPRVEEALHDRIGIAYPRFGDGDRQFKADNITKLFTVPAGDRASLDPNLPIFSADGHVNGDSVLVEEVGIYLKSSAKTAGGDVAAYFGKTPYGWQEDLLRYCAAAMFVDGKLSLIDKAGKRFDDPKVAPARALFGTAAFRTTRLEVEEESLTPAESSQARQLLGALEHTPADGGEIALRESVMDLCGALTKRLGVLQEARGVALPYPESYDLIEGTVEAITTAGSRVKVVRAALARATELRDADTALSRLEEFKQKAGFAQYRRSRELLTAALAAGLADDPKLGPTVSDARDQMAAIIAQRRILDDWEGQYANYRVHALKAFRGAYQPLRESLAQRTVAADKTIRAMPEYDALELNDRVLVRTQFLGEGRPLHPIAVPELKNEEQLLAANAEYSIGHLDAVLIALDSQLTAARELVIQLHNARIGKPDIVVWRLAEAFGNSRFETEDQVEAAFNAARDQVKKLLREGKVVQVG